MFFRRFVIRRAGALLGAVLAFAALAGTASAQGKNLVEVPVTAKGAVLIDADSGRVLFGLNEHERLPMASTTKIMTALLTLEQPGLDDPFTVDPDAILVEGSSMGLRKEDTVTLRSLAYGMLLSSGNDAANAAAVHIAKTIPAFADRMNQRAGDLGLEDTHFVTPSGLDNEEHYSTAYDMAMLGRAALENPDFAEICSKSSAKVSFGNPPYDRWLSNHNRLLREYEGAVGVKTGFTKKSGRCLVSAAERGDITLICVTLGAADDWNAHKALYDKGFSLLQEYSLESLMPPTRMAVTGSSVESVRVAPEDQVFLHLSQEEFSRIQVSVQVKKLEYAPLPAGSPAGEVKVSLDGGLLRRIPLVTAEEAPLHPDNRKKGFFEQLGYYYTKYPQLMYRVFPALASKDEPAGDGA